MLDCSGKHSHIHKLIQLGAGNKVQYKHEVELLGREASLICAARMLCSPPAGSHLVSIANSRAQQAEARSRAAGCTAVQILALRESFQLVSDYSRLQSIIHVCQGWYIPNLGFVCQHPKHVW